ncbi:MAG: hypothetical protein Q8M98_00885 [Candidatus Cloacimonadaceae bacterium]|nr:hypothetical protein [Candidatus Cloacimonadaceae bacterium]
MDDSHLIKFVGAMQKKYPNAIFRFEYDEKEASYRIWHTYNKVYADNKFCEYMGKLIKEIFIPIGFFNFYIDLNTEFMKKMNNAKSWAYNSTKPISSSFQDVESYTSNTSPFMNRAGCNRITNSKSPVDVVSREESRTAERETPIYRMAA